ncbi:MAG: pantoate--beta-alanine ligase, partial [Gemmatimonadaceae bacterium]
MKFVETISEMRLVVADARTKDQSIAFVPTMGALHEGHLTLVDEAKRVADLVVMSIFVNPLQFGPSEDFARYPRMLDDDAKLANERGVDLLFTPRAEEMYPEHAPVIIVHPGSIGKEWEGAVRPHHFEGVLTVVAKLFHIVIPDVAVFGQKDLQQVACVKAMVRDLNFPLGILVAPTVREP